MIVYFSFLFSNFSFGINKRYTQLMSIASPWNFTAIWHTGTCCPDIRHFNKYTSGIYCIITGIPTYHWINITWMVLRGILVSLHFITAWSYTLMSTPYTAFILCTPCNGVYTLYVLTLSYWYTSLHKRYIVHTTWYIYSPWIQLVYNMYTSGFILKAVYTTILH